jgi:hypothetical protein
MFEYVDNTVEHIVATVKMPYDIIVVDNGSDIVEPSKYTTVWIEENVQMTRGFMTGVRFADHLELELDEPYFAYWIITTSCAFFEMYKNEDYMSVDPLELLLKVLVDDPLAYAVQPAMEFNFGAWIPHHSPRPGKKVRRLWALEPTATLYNAEHFNRLGRWDEELTYGWGISAESYYFARKEGLHIYNHDGYVMRKETGIGYEMDRMGMTFKERQSLAIDEVKRIFTPKYGKDYLEYLNWAHRETGRGEY